jgi:F-type H+-transporting ATPase subunit b
MVFPFLAVGVQDLVDIAPWTIIAQICNLLLQVYLFKRFLFEPVKKIVQKRQDEVNEIYDSAAEADKQAKIAKDEYETMLASAKNEAADIVQSATLDAQQRSDEIVRVAKDEAATLKKKASADIERERRKALNEVKDDISGIALDIAEKVVEKEISAKDQQALIEDFIQKMGEVQ